MLKMRISQEIINMNSNWYCIIHRDPSDFGPTNQNPSKPDINIWMIKKKKVLISIKVIKNMWFIRQMFYWYQVLLSMGSRINPPCSLVKCPNSNHSNLITPRTSKTLKSREFFVIFQEKKHPTKNLSTFSGWWWNTHLEKYEFVSWEGWHPINMKWKIKKIHGLKPPTRYD